VKTALGRNRSTISTGLYFSIFTMESTSIALYALILIGILSFIKDFAEDRLA
jgi:hypothetical protein